MVLFQFIMFKKIVEDIRKMNKVDLNRDSFKKRKIYYTYDDYFLDI